MFNKNKKKKIVLSDELKKKMVLSAKHAFKETEVKNNFIKDIIAAAEKHGVIGEEEKKMIKNLNKSFEEVKLTKDWLIQELGDYVEEK